MPFYPYLTDLKLIFCIIIIGHYPHKTHNHVFFLVRRVRTTFSTVTVLHIILPDFLYSVILQPTKLRLLLSPLAPSCGCFIYCCPVRQHITYVELTPRDYYHLLHCSCISVFVTLNPEIFFLR